jgi:hypothetical protein
MRRPVKFLAIALAIALLASLAPASPTTFPRSFATTFSPSFRDASSYVPDNYVLQGYGDSQTETRLRWCGGAQWAYPTYCANYGVGGTSTVQIITDLLAELAVPTGKIHSRATHVVMATGSNDYADSTWADSTSECAAACASWSVMTDDQKDSVYKDQLQAGIAALVTAGYVPVLWQSLPRCATASGNNCDDYYNPDARVADFQTMFAEVVSANPTVPVVRGWDAWIPYFDGAGGLSTTSILSDHVHMNEELGSQLIADAVRAAIGDLPCDGTCCGDDLAPQIGLVYHFEPAWSVRRGSVTSCTGTQATIATTDNPTPVVATCSGTVTIDPRPSDAFAPEVISFGASPSSYTSSGVNYPAGALPVGQTPNIEFSIYYAWKDTTVAATTPAGFTFGDDTDDESFFILGQRASRYGVFDRLSDFNHRRDLSQDTLADNPLASDGVWRVQSATVGTDGEIRLYLGSTLELAICHDIAESMNTGVGTNVPPACPTVSGTSEGIRILEVTDPRIGFPIYASGSTSDADVVVSAALLYNVEKTGAEHAAVVDYLERCVVGP